MDQVAEYTVGSAAYYSHDGTERDGIVVVTDIDENDQEGPYTVAAGTKIFQRMSPTYRSQIHDVGAAFKVKADKLKPIVR